MNSAGRLSRTTLARWRAAVNERVLGKDSIRKPLGSKPNGRRNFAILLGRVDGFNAQYSGL
jgi:hypothetical protein